MALNSGMKQIVTIASVGLLSFPVIFIVVMFATGNIRIEFGKPKAIEAKRETEIMQRTQWRDSLSQAQTQTFQAMLVEREKLQHERERLAKQQDRIDMLQQELESTKNELEKKRQELAALVQESSELDKKRIRQLAGVYGAMRAPEAARILETLDDELSIKILSAISDDRQKAKIVSSLSSEKATRISKKMGAE